jgi:hypothetical protein
MSNTTEDECIEALQRAADSLGTSPSKAQYERLGVTPASATIIRVMGTWNDAKAAADLATAPSSGSRTAPQPDDVDLPDGSSWEELTVDQRWHYRNTEWNTKRSLDRRDRHRAWLHEYKAGEGCVRCSETDPACLDFHHLDEADKEMSISQMVTHGYARPRLREEIEKCEVCVRTATEKNTTVSPTPRVI